MLCVFLFERGLVCCCGLCLEAVAPLRSIFEVCVSSKNCFLFLASGPRECMRSLLGVGDYTMEGVCLRSLMVCLAYLFLSSS